MKELERYINYLILDSKERKKLYPGRFKIINVNNDKIIKDYKLYNSEKELENDLLRIAVDNEYSYLRVINNDNKWVMFYKPINTEKKPIKKINTLL